MIMVFFSYYSKMYLPGLRNASTSLIKNDQYGADIQ